MLRIVLDANQFVSAVLNSQSNSGKIVDLVIKNKLELIASEQVFAEVKRVLFYQKLLKLSRYTLEDAGFFLAKLRKVALIAPGELKFDAVKDDPTDNKYLTCAVEGRADFIISGDHHLKDLKTFQGIKIVDPGTFLKTLYS